MSAALASRHQARGVPAAPPHAAPDRPLPLVRHGTRLAPRPAGLPLGLALALLPGLALAAPDAAAPALPAALPGLAAGSVVAVLLVYLRLQAMILAMPGFGERLLSTRIRVGLAVALTPLFAPLAAAGPPLAGVPVAAALGELVLGLALGLQLRLFALGLAVAAAAIAATASLSQLIGGDTEMAPHPIGNIMQLGGLALLMALGLPLMLADYAAASFALWPSGALPDIAGLVPALVATVARGFSLALVLASPFILGGLLYQALGAIVGKVMPALPVVFVGAPAAILLALAALVLLTGPLLGVWADGLLSIVPADLLPAAAGGPGG